MVTCLSIVMFSIYRWKQCCKWSALYTNEALNVLNFTFLWAVWLTRSTLDSNAFLYCWCTFLERGTDNCHCTVGQIGFKCPYELFSYTKTYAWLACASDWIFILFAQFLSCLIASSIFTLPYLLFSTFLFSPFLSLMKTLANPPRIMYLTLMGTLCSKV